jgi:hypothetical protein
MRALRLPKVLVHRVLNGYANFNDGVVDRSLYASFVELRPFLQRVAAELVSTAKNRRSALPADELSERIERSASSFEQAYRNRFHNSQKLGDVTDFSFEFKGGFQQVVTAFDAAYKALGSVLGSRDAFVNVGANPGIHSTEYEVQLNYFHIFQPELFFAVAGKEASNWFVVARGGVVSDYVKMLVDGEVSEEERFERACWAERAMRNALSASGILPAMRQMASPWLRASFFESVLSDLLTFYSCYAGDWDLFSHWTLGYFLQMADAYDDRGHLDQAELARFLFRLRIVGRSVTARRFQGSIERFGDKAVSDVSRALMASGQLDLLCAQLEADELFREWLQRAHAEAQAIARAALASDDSAALPTVLTEARTRGRVRAREIAAGMVPRFEPDGRFDRFRFCQAVLYGYLHLVKQKAVGQVATLNRTASGDARIPRGSGGLLFDPMGGLFAHHPRVRRELFRYRSAVTMGLWDLGLKAKRKLVSELVSQGGKA